MILRAASRRKAPTPLGALARGLIAGAAGAGLQSLFFMATARVAPEPTRFPKGVAKPANESRGESATEAVARRFNDKLMRREPLEDKKRAATVVHYLFGAAWGGLYALCRESFRTSPMLFGAFVWAVSDHLLLPGFRLAAWPQKYSLREHHYALQAHFAYGLGTAATYAVLRDVGAAPLAALPALVALQARAWALRTPPGRLVQAVQPFPKRAINHFLEKAALA
jgi:hypothetical protein